MSASSSETFEPNLTPILDMVFQLITFFMLVINFKAYNVDQSLKLPVLGSARPLAYEGRHEPITLNLNKDGTVRAYGQLVELDSFIKKEADVLKLLVEKENGDSNTIPVPVIVRADREVPFQDVMKAMQTCRAAGMTNIALSAMSREEAP